MAGDDDNSPPTGPSWYRICSQASPERTFSKGSSLKDPLTSCQDGSACGWKANWGMQDPPLASGPCTNLCVKLLTYTRGLPPAIRFCATGSYLKISI